MYRRIIYNRTHPSPNTQSCTFMTAAPTRCSTCWWWTPSTSASGRVRTSRAAWQKKPNALCAFVCIRVCYRALAFTDHINERFASTDGEFEYEHLAGGLKASLLEDPACLDADRLAAIDGGWQGEAPGGEGGLKAAATACALEPPMNHFHSRSPCITLSGPGVRRLLRWHRDLPLQEERARLLREVIEGACICYCLLLLCLTTLLKRTFWPSSVSCAA